MPELPMPSRATRRIGLIIPSANRVVEHEVARHMPSCCQAHVTRLRMTGANWVPLDQLLVRAADAALSLVDAGCAAIVFNCTASSMEQGKAGNEALLSCLREAAGTAQATTTATAMLDALAELGARRVVLVTPYSEEVTARARAFLQECGISVLASVARDVSGKGPYWDIPAASWQAELVAARHPDADAYVLSCANITCLDMIAAAEAALGAPIVTTNQAVLVQALRLAGVAALPAGLGALTRVPRAPIDHDKAAARRP